MKASVTNLRRTRGAAAVGAAAVGAAGGRSEKVEPSLFPFSQYFQGAPSPKKKYARDQQNLRSTQGINRISEVRKGSTESPKDARDQQNLRSTQGINRISEGRKGSTESPKYARDQQNLRSTQGINRISEGRKGSTESPKHAMNHQTPENTRTGRTRIVLQVLPPVFR